MPQPTSSDVHVSRPLGNISVAYQQNAANFIAARVFPQVPVAQQFNQYWKYTKGDFHRTEAKVRPPGTETPGSGWTVDLDTYAAIVHGVHKDIDDQIRANADSVFNLEREATNFVTNQLLLKRDLDWITAYFATGIWTGGDVDGVPGAPGAGQFQQWDQAGSTPIEDITNAGIAVMEGTGYTPNRLVLSPYVYNVLRNHETILDRIKYTQRGMVTAELLASLFDVDQVLVANAVQDTAAEEDDAVLQFIAPKNALLVYAAPAPGLMQVSGGYTFTWNGLLGAVGFGTRVRRFRMEELTSDRIEGEMAYDQKLVAADVGYFFEDAVA